VMVVFGAVYLELRTALSSMWMISVSVTELTSISVMTMLGNPRRGGGPAGGVGSDVVEAGELEAGELAAGELETGELEAGELETGELEAGELETGGRIATD